MDKLLYIDGQKITVQFIEKAKCWRSTALIDGALIEIEIDFEFYKGDFVEWDNFESFFHFINQPGLLKSYITETIQLISQFGKAVFKHSNETHQWEAQFSNCIYYNGQKNSNYLFSLIYYFAHNTEGWGDESGNYLADYESNNLSGIRRIQN